MTKTNFFTKSRMLGYGKRGVLGFQHLFAMLGATILVPMLTGLNTSIALIGAGVGTIIFHFCGKRMVPVFLGSSFAFMGAIMQYRESMSAPMSAYALGAVAVAIVFAGAIYLIFALLVKLLGPGFIKRLFPPIVVGSVIMVIGLTLAPNLMFNNIVKASSPVWASWLVAFVTAAIIVAVSVFAKGFFKMLPILFGITGGYIFALILHFCGVPGLFDFSVLTDANWILFQPAEFSNAFGFYKHLRFDWGVILSIAPIAIVTFMEHIGDITANGAVVNKDFYIEPGIHRTLMGDGLATIFAGLIGAPPNTTYGENTGVLALTKNYDPINMVVAAGIAIFLGVFTKFGAVISTIPASVIGGASVVLFGMITVVGLRTLIDAKVDFTENKNVMVASFILVIGIGLGALNTFNIFYFKIGNVNISALALATVIGIALNLLFSLGGKKNNTEDAGPDVLKTESANDEKTEAGEDGCVKDADNVEETKR